MKSLSYNSIRPGIQALGSYSVRIGTKSKFSHTEIMFEPGDDVEHLVPDGNLEPIDGAYWCASASAADIIPVWSKRRAGRTGGVRFKRINPNTGHWLIQDLPSEEFSSILAATWFKEHEGLAYDWQHIFSFIGVAANWVFTQGVDKYTCTEACAAALLFKEPERFHPGNFPPVIDRVVLKVPTTTRFST